MTDRLPMPIHKITSQIVNGNEIFGAEIATFLDKHCMNTKYTTI